MADGNPFVVTNKVFTFQTKVTGAEEATEDYQDYGNQVCLALKWGMI